MARSFSQGSCKWGQDEERSFMGWGVLCLTWTMSQRKVGRSQVLSPGKQRGIRDPNERSVPAPPCLSPACPERGPCSCRPEAAPRKSHFTKELPCPLELLGACEVLLVESTPTITKRRPSKRPAGLGLQHHQLS